MGRGGRSGGRGQNLRHKHPKRTSTNNPPFPKNTGTPILVPLTPSLYVPGNLAATDTVLVDVGTGFYVEKVTFVYLLSYPLIISYKCKG